MNFNLKICASSETSEHRLELRPEEATQPAGGKLRFILDGSREPQYADWVEITPGAYSIIVGSRSYEAHVACGASDSSSGSDFCTVTVEGQEYRIAIEDARARRRRRGAGAQQGPQEIVAPMPGKIVKVLVRANEHVY